MKQILLNAVFLFSGVVYANECISSGTVCNIPGTSGNDGIYKVFSPVGASSIKNIKQAPRLSTLKGKNIAVVGGSFMASVTHPEIKRLILQKFDKYRTKT